MPTLRAASLNTLVVGAAPRRGEAWKSGRPRAGESPISSEAPISQRHHSVTELGRPTWSNWKEALRVVAYPPYLKKTLRIALIVGCLLFVINQLDIVLRGQATPRVWIKGALTFLVPFCVSNVGILVASRRRHGSPPAAGPPLSL